MKTVDLKIEGMTCEQCAVTIDKSLTLGGIEDKTVSYPKAKASVSFDETLTSAKEIIEQINGIGHYKVVGSSDIEADSNAKHLIVVGGWFCCIFCNHTSQKFRRKSYYDQ